MATVLIGGCDARHGEIRWSDERIRLPMVSAGEIRTVQDFRAGWSCHGTTGLSAGGERLAAR
jgi:hypothetical protein